MVKRNTTNYECSNCGAKASSWSGRCNVCGEWNTLQEQLVIGSANIAGGGAQLKAQSVGELAKRDQLKRLST